MEYSQSQRIAQAAEAFAVSCDNGCRELSDSTLCYYVQKYGIAVDDDVMAYLTAVRERKIPPIEPISADKFIPQINALSGQDSKAFRPIVYQLTKNYLMFSPEYNNTRKIIINDFWKNQTIEQIQSDVSKSFIMNYLSVIANDLLMDFPTKFVAEQKIGNSVGAILIYTGKKIYHESCNEYVEKIYNEMLTIHKVDSLKKRINPYNRDRMKVIDDRICFPEERESASADRCF